MTKQQGSTGGNHRPGYNNDSGGVILPAPIGSYLDAIFGRPEEPASPPFHGTFASVDQDSGISRRVVHDRTGLSVSVEQKKGGAYSYRVGSSNSVRKFRGKGTGAQFVGEVVLTPPARGELTNPRNELLAHLGVLATAAAAEYEQLLANQEASPQVSEQAPPQAA